MLTVGSQCQATHSQHEGVPIVSGKHFMTFNAHACLGKSTKLGTGEMAQQLELLLLLQRTCINVLSTQVKQLTTLKAAPGI